MADLNDCISKNTEKHVDKALHLWFLQQRAVRTPTSGLLLQTKVKIFYDSKFHPDDNNFQGKQWISTKI